MQGFVQLLNRGIISLTGTDRLAFLDRLIGNSIAPDGITYALLLSPQGKYLHDFFIHQTTNALLIDCPAVQTETLLQRLAKYKLRSAIELADVTSAYCVYAVFGELAGQPDPRNAAMGNRLLAPTQTPPVFKGPELGLNDYEQQRLRCLLPDILQDVESERSFPLECNFDIANAISFSKGCYIGQELTARMRYRGLLRRRLALLQFAASAPVTGTAVLCEGEEIGQLGSSNGQFALSRLPLDYKNKPMTCAGQPVNQTWPDEPA